MLPWVDLNRPFQGPQSFDERWDQIINPSPPSSQDINEFLLRQHENRQPTESSGAPWLQQNMDLGGSMGMQRPFQSQVDQFPLLQQPDSQNFNNPRGAVPWYMEQTSLSGPRQQLPGGAFDLGIDPLTSPFAPSGVQDLNQHNRLGGMTGPYGGTDPRFFGGGIGMPDWSEPPLTPQQSIDTRFPTPWQIDTFMPMVQPQTDNFSSRFNSVYEQPSHFMPGDPFAVEQQHQQAGNPWIPQGLESLAQAPFDDPRGDFIGPVGGRNTIPTPPGGYGYPTPLPVTQPLPFFTGGGGFAPGLTPQGYTPPLQNFGGPPAPSSNWVPSFIGSNWV